MAAFPKSTTTLLTLIEAASTEDSELSHQALCVLCILQDDAECRQHLLNAGGLPVLASWSRSERVVRAIARFCFSDDGTQQQAVMQVGRGRLHVINTFHLAPNKLHRPNIHVFPMVLDGSTIKW